MNFVVTATITTLKSFNTAVGRQQSVQKWARVEKPCENWQRTTPCCDAFCCFPTIQSFWLNSLWEISVNWNTPYSGKFLWGPNFRDFMTHDRNAKIKTAKIWTPELMYSSNIFTHAFCAPVLLLDNGTVSLFETSRRQPTLSHGTSFVLRESSDDKSCQWERMRNTHPRNKPW